MKKKFNTKGITLAVMSIISAVVFTVYSTSCYTYEPVEANICSCPVAGATDKEAKELYPWLPSFVGLNEIKSGYDRKPYRNNIDLPAT